MKAPEMFGFIKNSECLSLRHPKKSGFITRVIGGSEISKALAETGTERSPWLGRGCHWGATLYVLAMALVFGGTAGTVTLGTSITVGGLTFNTTGYTVTTGANTLTFGGTNNSILVARRANRGGFDRDNLWG
jgi:hypothetical protein